MVLLNRKAGLFRERVKEESDQDIIVDSLCHMYYILQHGVNLICTQGNLSFNAINFNSNSLLSLYNKIVILVLHEDIT